MLKVKSTNNTPPPIDLSKSASPKEACYRSSNPFLAQPIGPAFLQITPLKLELGSSSYSSSNPFPNQPTSPSSISQQASLLPLPEEAGFKKEKASLKRKRAPCLLPAHEAHSPSYMENRRATSSKIRYLFKKWKHSFRTKVAKKDQAETLEPNEKGEIQCNGRIWGIHHQEGKRARVYPKKGPGIYTFSGKELKRVFKEYLALKTDLKFEDFLIQRAETSS